VDKSVLFTNAPQSYICGFVNIFAWIASTSGVAILTAQGILAMVIFYQPDYVPESWHYFLVFQAVNMLVCIHNVFTFKRTLWLNDAACKWRSAL
jgi:choline transport protein